MSYYFPEAGTQQQAELGLAEQYAADLKRINEHDDPNVLLTQYLIGIVRSAVILGVPEKDARVLCFALGLNASDVL